MSSEFWFALLIGLVALERVAELVVSQRNARWSFEQGGLETGRGHFPYMVILHIALLVGALIEVLVADRQFIPTVGWLMLALVIAAQALRWWCIASLGKQWNTRVIVVPGAQRITRGPYRWLRHPNYVAVVLEGIALPLVHNAWVVAVVFTFLNYFILRIRLAVENRALNELASDFIP
jgi:methyltransferase